MNTRKIKILQKKYNLKVYQDAISNGTAWTSTASFAQKCKEHILSGACYLPPKSFYIHFHSVVPSRNQVPRGSYGTIEYSKKYWSDQWNHSVLVGQMIAKEYA